MQENTKVLEIAKAILAELDNFDERHQVRDPSTDRAIFVANTFKDGNRTLAAQIHQQQETHDSLRQRFREPFIAYVETQEGGDGQTVYLVCRGYTPNFHPLHENAFFMDYHSDLGRAVEVEVGSSFSTRGASGKLLAKNTFEPMREKGFWDGIQNEFSFADHKFLIQSLRELLNKSDGLMKTKEAEKDIAKIAELQKAHDEIIQQMQATFQGLRRHVRSRIELRDQQILDTVC